MGGFELTLNEEIKILIHSGLTPTELFILRLLYLSVGGATSLLSNYIANISNGEELLRNVLQSLVNKNIINSTYTIPSLDVPINANNIPFNKSFIKKYLKDSEELGKELFYAYPHFVLINGKMCSIRNITKAGLFGFDDFCAFYAKIIKSAAVTHERILEALEFGKANNLISYSIIEFLASRKWEEIEYIRDSGNVNGYNNSELL